MARTKTSTQPETHNVRPLASCRRMLAMRSALPAGAPSLSYVDTTQNMARWARSMALLANGLGYRLAKRHSVHWPARQQCGRALVTFRLEAGVAAPPRRGARVFERWCGGR